MSTRLLDAQGKETGEIIRTPIPKGTVVHYQGFRDPIDAQIRMAVTRCGVQIKPGTHVTSEKDHMSCEACGKAKT